MRKILTMLALLIISPATFAWNCEYWHQNTNSGGECYQPPAAGAVVTANSFATATAQAQAAARQSQVANGGNAQATNAGNTQSTSYAYPRQVPPAFSGQVSPTVSCASARNGGVSSLVFGASFGFSTIDKGCERREDARYLWAFGQRRQAVELLCMDARKLGLKNCHYAVPKKKGARPIAATRPVSVTKYVTQSELKKVERRIVKGALSK